MATEGLDRGVLEASRCGAVWNPWLLRMVMDSATLFLDSSTWILLSKLLSRVDAQGRCEDR